MRNNLGVIISYESMKKVLNFKEITALYREMPPTKMLWSGVKEKSFGLVFGPSKSGKTIFCENLGMSLAVGKKDFFDYPLDGIPKKVLFIGLEEHWAARVERNIKQFETLSVEEQALLEANYLYQPIDSSKLIIKDEDWENLENTIKKSGSEVVFIDSITRLNHGKLEDSSTAEKIMVKLRNIAHDLNITLFAIHHTPKMFGKPISIDSIKGSSTFAQEADFAIGINRTDKNYRYMKNVFFRYASDDDEFVREFVTPESTWLEYIDEVDENEIILRSDRRRKDDSRDVIVGFFNKNPQTTYTSSEAVNYVMNLTDVKERQAKTYLSDMSKNNKIKSLSRGIYCSVNYIAPNNEGNNE